MRRLPLRLLGVLGLFALLALGCQLFPWSDQVIYGALDYRIDRPRLLALAVDPPVLRSDLPVTFEALALAPGGARAGGGVWQTCGLSQDDWTMVWGLTCFTEGVDVSTLASGNPAAWTPPAFDIACDTGGGGDFWGQPCGHFLPFLYQVDLGGRVVRGTFSANVSAEEVEEPPTSLRHTPLQVTAGEPVDGEVALEAWIGAPYDSLSFRWYVDDGTLLDTGRTAVQGQRDDGTWSANRWVLPTAPGSYRAVVVVSGADGWSAEVKVDTAPPDTAPPGWSWPEAVDMTWALLTVEVPG
ncbi:MAG: hypothetical protein ABIO70_36895 [Pseudomonadota bacterium]